MRTARRLERRGAAPGRTARPRRGHRGFTLIETALATVIVGVGVLALVAAQQAFHQQNYWSTHASIAERLGNEIREMTLNLPRHDPVTSDAYWGSEPNEVSFLDYDDVDDFDGAGAGLVFGADWDAGTADNGPVNAQREIITNMEGWTQVVTVHNVDPFDISDPTIPPDFSTNMVVVEVVVTYQGPNDLTPTEMTRVTWVAPN